MYSNFPLPIGVCRLVYGSSMPTFPPKFPVFLIPNARDPNLIRLLDRAAAIVSHTPFDSSEYRAENPKLSFALATVMRLAAVFYGVHFDGIKVDTRNSEVFEKFHGAVRDPDR